MAVAPRLLGETELSGVSLARVCRCHFGADSDDDTTWDACHVESSETAAGDDGRPRTDGRRNCLRGREGGGDVSIPRLQTMGVGESRDIRHSDRNVVRARAQLCPNCERASEDDAEST